MPPKKIQPKKAVKKKAGTRKQTPSTPKKPKAPPKPKTTISENTPVQQPSELRNRRLTRHKKPRKREYTFQNILDKSKTLGIIPGKTKEARNWFREQASKLWETRGMRPPKKIISNSPNKKAQIFPGHMMLFEYDPKHKLTLPYYDIFPLIFPFRIQKGRMWGINMHYLPLNLRANLMDALYTIASDTRYDNRTRMILNYELLKSSAKFRFFKPTIHEYLFNHVRSQFVQILAPEWDYALFLPLDRFKKAPRAKVWKDSIDIIKGKKK